MNNASIDLSADAHGRAILTLRGGWTDDVERALTKGNWEILGLLGVNWKDYSPLLRYAQLVRWLRVPFGPDSSRGFDALIDLERVELTDALRPPIDFRKFTKLRWLETLWEGDRFAKYFAHPELATLIVHAIGGKDLNWLPSNSKLSSLALRKGGLKSLRGIEKAKHLREISVRELKQCTDIAAIALLENAESLEVDAPSAEIDSLDWTRSMPRLSRLLLSTQARNVDWRALAAHPSLVSIGVTLTEGASVSESDIRRYFTDAGREVLSIVRFGTSVPSLSLELK